MGFTKATYAVDNITSLSSTPNATEGLTAAQLQAKFDKTGADGKTFVNSLVDELDIFSGETLTALSKFNSTELLTGKNLNDYKTNGIYYFGTGCSNVPESYVKVLVLGDDTNDVVQIAVSEASENSLYIRTQVNGTWFGWIPYMRGYNGIIQSDCNFYKTQGIFVYDGQTTIANAPSHIGIFEVINGDTYIIQRVTSATTISIRSSYDSGANWSSWKSVTLT